jgi:hypothetical protein
MRMSHWPALLFLGFAYSLNWQCETRGKRAACVGRVNPSVIRVEAKK